MNQPDEQKINEQAFWKLFEAVDKEMFQAMIVMRQFQISPMIVEYFCRGLAQIQTDSGWGNVTAFISDYKVTAIDSKHAYKLDMPIVREEQKIT